MVTSINNLGGTGSIPLNQTTGMETGVSATGASQTANMDSIKAASAKAEKAVADTVKKEINLSDENITKAVDVLNRASNMLNHKLQFALNKDSGQLLVKIYDKESDKLIRQIPAERVINVMDKLSDLIGIMVDEKR